jgi:hypothetical protein
MLQPVVDGTAIERLLSPALTRSVEGTSATPRLDLGRSSAESSPNREILGPRLLFYTFIPFCVFSEVMEHCPV